MLIAILMSLNIVSVGYATWAIAGPSTSEAGGSFDSYPVIKSDEYVQLTGIEASFIDFGNYVYSEGVAQTQGAFVNVSDGQLIDKGDNGSPDGYPDQSATLTLTYTVKEAIDNMTIETELLFGKNNTDAANSKIFFGTAVPTVTSVDGAKGSLTDTDKDGVYLLTLSNVPASNVPANTTSITVVITLSITFGDTFDDSFLELGEDEHYRFFADTVVKGDLQ